MAQDLLGDASNRIQFQHEYTLAGFKTLIYLEGGSIIALLTYAGHSDGSIARRFAPAILLYAGALVVTVLGYLTAYASQGDFANHSAMNAYQFLGLEPVSKRSADFYRTRGTIFVYLGIGLCVLSLGGFIAGCWKAMLAIG